jgi:hypothetical protein
MKRRNRGTADSTAGPSSKHREVGIGDSESISTDAQAEMPSARLLLTVLEAAEALSGAILLWDSDEKVRTC